MTERLSIEMFKLVFKATLIVVYYKGGERLDKGSFLFITILHTPKCIFISQDSCFSFTQ